MGKKSAKPFDERDILGDGYYLCRFRCTMSPLQLALPNECDDWFDTHILVMEARGSGSKYCVL